MLASSVAALLLVAVALVRAAVCSPIGVTAVDDTAHAAAAATPPTRGRIGLAMAAAAVAATAVVAAGTLPLRCRVSAAVTSAKAPYCVGVGAWLREPNSLPNSAMGPFFTCGVGTALLLVLLRGGWRVNVGANADMKHAAKCTSLPLLRPLPLALPLVAVWKKRGV